VTTGFAAAPTVLYSETQATPGNYDDEIDSVSIDSKTGTVYFADQYSGIYAFPNNGGVIPLTGGQPTNLYAVSPQGAKTITLDPKDDIYIVSYNATGDSLAEVTDGSVTLPSSTIGVGVTNSPATNPISVILNDGCLDSRGPACHHHLRRDWLIRLLPGGSYLYAGRRRHTERHTDRNRFQHQHGNRISHRRRAGVDRAIDHLRRAFFTRTIRHFADHARRNWRRIGQRGCIHD